MVDYYSTTTIGFGAMLHFIWNLIEWNCLSPRDFFRWQGVSLQMGLAPIKTAPRGQREKAPVTGQ